MVTSCPNGHDEVRLFLRIGRTKLNRLPTSPLIRHDIVNELTKLGSDSVLTSGRRKNLKTTMYAIAKETPKSADRELDASPLDATYNSDLDNLYEVKLEEGTQSSEANNDEYGVLPHQNRPHPMLEFPLLYQALRTCCSGALKALRALYTFRWSLSYPLQHRLPFTRTLRKLRIIYTWSELLMILPFFACILAAALYSSVYPSVSISGHAARTPLIFAFATAMHNSFLTLFLGLPFERALRYHKLAARMAYFNSILHTYVAFRFPDDTNSPSNFFSFLFHDQINSGGTMLVVFMTGIVLTALPMVRRKMFEVFYYLHITCCVSMTVCAFFHTGYMVPLIVALCWGGDLFFRKVVMAWLWYPAKAQLRIISDTVVEVSFPKTRRFAFNPGQYVSICVPELTVWQWHPLR